MQSARLVLRVGCDVKSWHLNLERMSNIEAVLRATELDMRGVEIIPQIFRDDARDVALEAGCAQPTPSRKAVIARKLFAGRTDQVGLSLRDLVT